MPDRQYKDLTEDQQRRFDEQKKQIEDSQIDADKMSDEEIKERIRKILETTRKTEELLNEDE